MKAKPVLELVAQFEPQVPGVVTEADLRIDDRDHLASDGLNNSSVVIKVIYKR